MADNVASTIDTYRAAWSDTSAPATVLTNRDCLRLLHEHYPSLVKHFIAEKAAMYKADICRLAVLYGEGGYYFDVDMVALTPFSPTSLHTFVTAICHNKPECIFQSFIASTPRHPAAKFGLDKMFDIYSGRVKMPSKNWKGTYAMHLAIESWRKAEPKVASAALVLLKEDMFAAPSPLAKLQRSTAPGGGTCNRFVMNPSRPTAPYFLSRFMGAKFCGESWACAEV
jgi:mannosyltransferase OCH1-like enzyme